MDRVDEVIEYWFGRDPVPTQATFARWFTRDPAFDDEIRQRFGDLHAGAAQLTHWRGQARSELALIIVLDQFSRNLYRDDPRAFERDALAREVAHALRASGRDRELTYHQRMIALLPLEHTEDRATQAESVAAFQELFDEAQAAGADGGVIGAMASALDYAKKHALIIDRFGRFPHRNRVLGRTSTAEELAFLEQPGSSF